MAQDISNVEKLMPRRRISFEVERCLSSRDRHATLSGCVRIGMRIIEGTR